MFRQMKSGYRQASYALSDFNESFALAIVKLIGECLTTREIDAVFCRYLHRLPSRTAAKKLSTFEDSISKQEFALRLEAAGAKIDVTMSLITVGSR